MNEELWMNDTFDNFTFSELGKSLDGKIESQKSTELRREKSIDFILCDTTNKKSSEDISFDDTIFLSGVSLTSLAHSNNFQQYEERESNFGNEVINVYNNSLDYHTVSQKLEQYNMELSENYNKRTGLSQSALIEIEHDSVSQSSNRNEPLNLELHLWGLPEAILKRYAQKKITKMFPWQVECLSNKNIIKNNANLVYSAPTSAGKTLVAEILTIKTVIERKKKVVFILPYVSVVREKVYYFKDIFEETKTRVDGFMGSYNPPGGFDSVNVAICTIEKANSLINKLLAEKQLSLIGAVIVDEIHLIGDPSRGYLLELLLTKLRYMSLKNEDVQIQIIGMSATLPNLSLLADWLNAELYVTDFRPVPLYELVHVCGEIYDNQLSFLRRLTPSPDLDVDTDNILQLCIETIQESSSVLIFCPTKNWCENLAQQIAMAFWKLGSSGKPLGQVLRSQLNTELIAETLEQLKVCPVGLDEVLHKTVSFGVSFHHAGLTMDERDIIEGAFRNGALRVLIATSTLSSGVNLPARRVIIRTPIFHGKPIDCLTYRQMIGRAGRMGKDTVGESILICQKNDQKVVKDLVSTELDEVHTCLEDSGKIKRAILEIIASGVAATPNDIELFTNCTLLSYSHRQSTDKHPIKEAIDFLHENEFIRLQEMENGTLSYVATSLGKACLSSSLPPHEGLTLFAELEKARRCFVLDNELHLVYLVTPYSACNQWGNIDWMLFLELWNKLPACMKKVGELVGVEESYIISASRGKINTNTSKLYHKLMVHKRFFVALALQDLVNEKSLIETTQKFNCNRGMLQSLQQSASTFAGMVTSFSKQLRWTSVEILISQFQDRLHYGVSRDLLDLMKLPILNSLRARALFNSGIETLSDLANSDIDTIENVLLNLTPFESTKEREGEGEFENKKRNKLRTAWIAGKQGITEREAAEMLICDARKYLEIELGLVEAKWNNKLGDKVSSDNNDDKVKISSQQKLISKQNNHNSTAVQLNSIDLTQMLTNCSITDEDMPDSSTSQLALSPLQLEMTQKVEPGNERVSIYIDNEKYLFDQSLFEDSPNSSFNTAFGSNDDGSIENSRNLLCNSKESSLGKEVDPFVNCFDDLDIEVPQQKKRRHSDNITPTKNETPFKKNKKFHSLSNNEDETILDFTKFDLVNVCKHPLIFEAFCKEIKTKNTISLSAGCAKSTLKTCNIGERIIDRNLPPTQTTSPLFCDESRLIDGIAVSWGSNTVYYLDLQATHYTNSIINLLGELASTTMITIQMFDSKEQMKVLQKCGIILKTYIEDPKIGDWLLEPDGREKHLKYLASEHCPEAIPILDLAGCHKGNFSNALDPDNSIEPRIRASVEALITHYLMINMKNTLLEQNSKLLDVFDIEMDCILILDRMEQRGFNIDKNYLDQLIAQLQNHLQSLEKKAYSAVGKKFSMASSKEVARVLGISNGKRTSTKKDVLKKINHPISELVLEWRKIHFTLYKMIIPILHEVKDNKIYVNCITHNSTGRITMHEPNLQNVARNFEIKDPVTDEISLVNCRKMFVSSKDSVLLSADYCQLELRLLAHFSEDETLRNIMRNKGDIFKSIAAKWNNIPESQISDVMRQHAKQICYGIIYGMGNKALAEQLSVEEEEATEFVESFHKSYPGLRRYIKSTIDNCREFGYVETLAGRRRYLPHIKDVNVSSKSQAERQSVNTTIQGSAADIAKKAMVIVERNLDAKYGTSDVKPGLVLHLHDELIYDVPSKYLRDVAKIVKDCMEKCISLSVPFPVKLKYGPSWGELTEFEL